MMEEPLYQVWFHDNAACAEAIRSDAPVEMALSTYGANDFMLDLLVGSGLWSVLRAMCRDGLQKENAKPWHALNGVEVLRGLARIKRIAHRGKIVRDARLMLIAGFNAEALYRARRRSQPVLDPETLANHLEQIGTPFQRPQQSHCFGPEAL